MDRRMKSFVAILVMIALLGCEDDCHQHDNLYYRTYQGADVIYVDGYDYYWVDTTYGYYEYQPAYDVQYEDGYVPTVYVLPR
jgi:hypothetical protein